MTENSEKYVENNKKSLWIKIATFALLACIGAVVMCVVFPEMKSAVRSSFFWRDFLICGALTLWGWAVPPAVRWTSRNPGKGALIGLGLLVSSLGFSTLAPKEILFDQLEFTQQLTKIAFSLFFFLGAIFLLAAWIKVIEKSKLGPSIKYSHNAPLPQITPLKNISKGHSVLSKIRVSNDKKQHRNILADDHSLIMASFLFFYVAFLFLITLISHNEIEISWIKYIISILIGCIIGLIRGKPSNLEKEDTK